MGKWRHIWGEETPNPPPPPPPKDAVTVKAELGDRIRRIGNDVGINLSHEELVPIVNNIYDPSVGDDLNKYNDRIYQTIDRISRQRADAEFKRQVDEIKTPKVTEEHKNAVANVFRDTLQREPTEREIESFAQDLARGDTSSYEIENFIRTTHPEYLKKQAEIENVRVKTESSAAREALNQELLRGEEEAFGRSQKNILGAYAQAGRLGSSGLDQALAERQKELERERQGFLAGAGYEESIRAQGYNREDFIGRQAAAYNEALRRNEPRYQSGLARSLYNTQTGLETPFRQAGYTTSALSDRTTRNREISDYNRQQNDFFRALKQQRKSSREAALYGMAGSLLGGLGTGAGYNLFGF